jgi:fumarate reductase subunit D
MKSLLKLPILLFNSIIALLVGIKNFFVGLFNKLKNPHHSSTMSFRGLALSAIVGVVLVLLFYFLKPFGLASKTDSEITILSCIIGFLSFAGMLICQFVLPFILKSFYDELHWTAGKQFIQLIIMVSIISFIVVYLYSSENIGSVSFPIDVFKLIGVCILPIFIFVLIQESMHDAKFKRKADELNADFKGKNFKNNANPLLVLNFVGSGEKLSLIPNQLIYVKIGSDESEFYYQHPFGVDKSTIKINEKAVRAELKDHPQFSEFQKNIILNAHAIQKISGSARGFEIGIARVNEMIKVPNKYRKNLEQI